MGLIRPYLFVLLFNIPFVLTSQSNVAYNDLLKKYVSEDGNVNYRGFITERAKFEAYLAHLSKYPPNSDWSRNQRMAYWINAYNAFTIKLIIDHYPLESITDLHPFFYIPGINTVWHEEFFQIRDEEMSLDRIEHKILRVEFDDARIHFAINCASFSCPNLRNEAYEPARLESQLNDQARSFINNPEKNIIKSNEVQLSKIFSWFKGDFDSEGGLISFLNQYSEITISAKADIDYLPYNWALNE